MSDSPAGHGENDPVIHPRCSIMTPKGIDQPTVFEVGADRAGEVTHVLCEAFHNYPVMRYIVGADVEAYDDKLHALVDFFVQARYLDGSPVLAIESNGVMAAAATLTAPHPREAPAELSRIREAVWAKLGAPARERYAGLCDIWGRFWLHEPHYHLNMIGVLPSHQGRGLSRILLDFVHAVSRQHPESRGVSLTTEVPENVRLYEHFGYHVKDREAVTLDFDTWGLFRAEQRG